MKNILILNHKMKNCGVYQYGLRTANILKKSTIYNFIYTEIDNLDEYNVALKLNNPFAVIYNNHLDILNWFSPEVVSSNRQCLHVGIIHEGECYKKYNYDYHIHEDSSSHDRENIFVVPRPLLEYTGQHKNPTIPTINSFGFGFADKGFDKIVNLVESQFDEACINLHMTHAFFGRPLAELLQLSEYCRSIVNKQNITLNITNNFLDENELLDFLASSTINVFLYNERSHTTRGLSSVIDYALSVDKPIAISKSNMFRHLKDVNPSIYVDERALSDIIQSGTEPLLNIKNKFSNIEFIKKYEYIFDCMCEK